MSAIACVALTAASHRPHGNAEAALLRTHARSSAGVWTQLTIAFAPEDAHEAPRITSQSPPIITTTTTMLCQRRASNLISSRYLSNARRHLSAATPASSTARVSTQQEERAPTRYMPATANGRFLIEQLNEHWSSAVAAIDFKTGSVIGTAPGIFHSRPTRFTIQVDASKHLEFAGGLEYVNHSCEPNARLVVSENTPEVAFVATRDIKEGEHLSFDYSTSEWDMDEKFDCRCGSHKCRGHIGGAKYLKDEHVAASMPLFTPPILRLLLDRKIGSSSSTE